MSFILLIKRISSVVDIIFVIVLFTHKFIKLRKNYMSENQSENQIVLPENDSAMQPLGIPRGSVRAILTIVLTLSVVAFWVCSALLGWSMPDYLLEMWLISIGYYVGYRTDNNPIKEIKI